MKSLGWSGEPLKRTVIVRLMQPCSSGANELPPIFGEHLASLRSQGSRTNAATLGDILLPATASEIVLLTFRAPRLP